MRARIAVRDLLSIDVRAEVRKICTRQSASPGDELRELVRLCLRFGATRVHIDAAPRGWALEAEGALLPPGMLEHLAAVADATASRATRHDALTSLEAEQGAALATLASGPEAIATVSDGTSACELHLRPPSRPQLSRRPVSPPRLRFFMRAPRLERARWAALAAACRFADVPVIVRTRLASRGFQLDDALLSAVGRRGPLECKVGLPRAGELSRLVIVSSGVVQREGYQLSRSGFVHTALVRVTDEAAVGAGLLATLDLLVQSLRARLYERLARGLDDLSPADQERGRELLLRLATRSGELRLIAGVPLFRRLEGGAVDLDALRSLARKGSVFALSTSPRRRRYAVAGQRIFLLGSRERELLARHADIRVEPPPEVRVESSRLRRRARQLWRAAKGALGRLGAALELRATRDTRQWEAARAIARALQLEVGSGRFLLPGLSAPSSRGARIELVARGSLPLRVRQRGEARLVSVPVGDRRLARLAATLESDATSLAPVFAALFAGHDGFAAHKDTDSRKAAIVRI